MPVSTRYRFSTRLVNVARRFKYSRPQYYKIRGVVAMSTDGSGVMNDVINNDPSGYQDWSALASLFDSYKTLGIKIRYTPDLPNDTSTTTSFKGLYVYGDPDSTTAVTSINEAIQYQNCKVFNMYRPWSYYYKIPSATSVANNGIVLSGGFRDAATTTARCCIAFMGSGFDLSTTYGTAMVTLYVALKNRR